MMETDNKTPFFKQVWFIGGVAAIAIFVLCFWAMDYVSRPDEPKRPDVEMKVIATLQTNEPLIQIARQQGWIAADATEMTSVDASLVDSIGQAFRNSALQSFSEFRYFIGVEAIDTCAFDHATQLKDIVIPANVISIEYGAFAHCPSLESISVDTANTHFDSREDCNGIVSTWKGKLMLVAGCRNTRLLDRMHYIAPQAFRGCTALTTIDFPERMEEIGDEAFAECTGLTEVTVPQGVRFVQPRTFAGCTSLTTITLSKSVERLQEGAFSGCTSLRKIVSPKKFPPIIEQAFDDLTATVYVPKGQLNTYFTNRYWKAFANYQELP